MQKPKKFTAALAAIITGILAGINFLGNIDFVVSRAQEPGWLMDVAKFLVNLHVPNWLVGGLALLSLSLVWYLLRHPDKASIDNRVSNSHGGDHWAERTQLEIHVLANVSAGRQPTDSPINKEPENTRLRELKDAIENKILEASLRDNKIDAWSKVKLVDFKRYVDVTNKSYWSEVLSRWESKQTTPTMPKKAPKTMPLIELLTLAQKQGWNFVEDGSQHIFEFVRSLRDAGSTESVTFWGRTKQRIDSMTREQALTKIEPTYWRKFKIDGISCLQTSKTGETIGIASENLQTRTQDDANIAQRHIYADIQLDRTQAIQWLSNEAPPLS